MRKWRFEHILTLAVVVVVAITMFLLMFVEIPVKNMEMFKVIIGGFLTLITCMTTYYFTKHQINKKS